MNKVYYETVIDSKEEKETLIGLGFKIYQTRHTEGNSYQIERAVRANYYCDFITNFEIELDDDLFLNINKFLYKYPEAVNVMNIFDSIDDLKMTIHNQTKTPLEEINEEVVKAYREEDLYIVLDELRKDNNSDQEMAEENNVVNIREDEEV